MAGSRRLVQFQWLGLALAAAGTVWWLWPMEEADPRFDARVRWPAYKGRGPKALIDEAHWNRHTAHGRYAPFASLLRRDGYLVAVNRQRFDARVLERADVLVIADALGVRGSMQEVANLAGLEGTVHLRSDAFDDDETVAVRDWVRDGGALLLAAGHAPFGEAARSLARQFGVEMTDGYLQDAAHHDVQTGTASFLVFSRASGLLLDHPITQGQYDVERIQQILTFSGQALKGPPGSVPFLKLSDQAVDFPRHRSRPVEGRPATGLAQGVAFESGKGRVVVLADASMLTSQVIRADGKELRIGMSRQGFDNQQLALNIMHWLTKKKAEVRSEESE
jgi:hypothetical protein